jgi:DNA topoisomerase-1
LKALLDSLSGVAIYREHVARIKGAGPLHPTRGGKETTDHPPIHPTGAADPERLTGQNWRVYNLVARRFLATLSDAAVIEGTKTSLDIGGQPFVARGDVLAVPGFRAVYGFGLKKDEVLPKLAEGDSVDVREARIDEKQTQPPARYSQGKLVQEMEKLGLGTKSTRAEIIQTLLDRRYIANEPVEPTVKGRTVVDALECYAERITTPEMTHQLDDEMDAISVGDTTRDRVVAHSRELLEDIMAVLLPRAEDVGTKLKDAADADATLGTCPKSGDDLRIKFSPKNKSYFVGCAGYPECDVTYPLPKGYKYEAVDELCPVCGTPQIKLIMFKRKPRIVCLDPACPTRSEPDQPIGACPAVHDDGTLCGGQIIAIRNPNTLKRYARCTNYEVCQTSYPLPALGDITPTNEPCDACGAPEIVIATKRGPWRICPNIECPTRLAKEAEKAEKIAAAKAGKDAATKKPAVRKKPAAKRKRATKPKA